MSQNTGKIFHLFVITPPPVDHGSSMFWPLLINSTDILSLPLQWAVGRLHNMAFLCYVLLSSGNDFMGCYTSLPLNPLSAKPLLNSRLFIFLLCSFENVS